MSPRKKRKAGASGAKKAQAEKNPVQKKPVEPEPEPEPEDLDEEEAEEPEVSEPEDEAEDIEDDAEEEPEPEDDKPASPAPRTSAKPAAPSEEPNPWVVRGMILCILAFAALWWTIRLIDQAGPGAYGNTMLGRLLGQNSPLESARQLLADGHFGLAMDQLDKIEVFNEEALKLKAAVQLLLAAEKLQKNNLSYEAREMLNRLDKQYAALEPVKILRGRVEKMVAQEEEAAALDAQQQESILERMRRAGEGEAEASEARRKERAAARAAILSEVEGLKPKDAAPKPGPEKPESDSASAESPSEETAPE